MQLSEAERKELQGVLGELVANEMKPRQDDFEKKFETRFRDLKGIVLQTRPMESFDLDEEGKKDLAGLGRFIKAAYAHAKHSDSRGLDEFGGLDGVMRKSEMSEGSDSAGGYLVPDGQERTILRIAGENSLFMPTALKVAMNGKTMRVPSLDTPPSVAWHSEGETMTETAPVLDEVELTAYRLDAYATVSNELLEDSAVDITNWLAREFSGAMATEVDNQVLNGTGTPCSGILTAAAGHSLVMAAGDTSFSAISPTYMSEMLSKLDSTVLSGAFFAMHQTVAHYLRTLTDTQGRYLVDLSDGRLWGQPLYTRNVCPSTSGVDTPFVALCNPKYLLMGMRYGSMRVDIDPYSLFTSYKTRIRVCWRMAIKVGKSAAFVRLLTAAS